MLRLIVVRFVVFIVIVLLSVLSRHAQAQTVPLAFGWQTRLTSVNLQENRKINIYLPENYQPNDSNRYMTIYLPDGGSNEDFFHVSALVRYLNQPWINQLPPAIVVGIENTHRRRDFTFAVDQLDFLDTLGIDRAQFQQFGGSANYMAFLENELMPYIQKNYRTNGHNMLIGESLAGLLATEILFKKSALFQSYIIVSPSLWWGNGQLWQQVDEGQWSKMLATKRICIVAPNKNEDVAMFDQAKNLYEILQPHASSSTFIYLEDETHATVFHEGVYRAIKSLYPVKN